MACRLVLNIREAMMIPNNQVNLGFLPTDNTNSSSETGSYVLDISPFKESSESSDHSSFYPAM